MTDYLAVFVTPEHQAVVNFMSHVSSDFDGYDPTFVKAENYQQVRQDLLKQAQDLFEALQQAGLNYVFSPLAYHGQQEQIIQRVRFPHQVLPNSPDNAGQFSCLDLVLLFASLIERIGFHPLLVLIRPSRTEPGHALVGWHIWQNEKDFLDITMISEERATFRKALQEGHRIHAQAMAQQLDQRPLYDQNGFMKIIDIAACRAHGIKPFL